MFFWQYVEDILQTGKFKRDFGKFQEDVSLDDAKGDHLNKSNRFTGDGQTVGHFWQIFMLYYV